MAEEQIQMAPQCMPHLSAAAARWCDQDKLVLATSLPAVSCNPKRRRIGNDQVNDALHSCNNYQSVRLIVFGL